MEMDAEKVAQLRAFVGYCKSNPSVLHDPSLGFFRDYLKSLGAQIPPVLTSTADFSVEITEESLDAAQMSKAKALDAISEGKFEEAIDYLTEAITLNPISAILYATRASVFVKMSKPDAAIRDADAALLINSDSAKGYKYRGMAKALLGNWEEAARDLHIASKLDHDEEIHSVLKMVEPNLQKIKEHQREYELLKKERERRKAETQRQPSEDSVFADLKAESKYLSVLQDGNVLSIHSSIELETKLEAATELARLAILYFTATWCGPCRSIAPFYKRLAEQHPKIVFLKIDIDEVHNVAHRWNVSSVPTFFFVKYGEEIDKVVGADKKGLQWRIDSHAMDE